MRKGDKMNCNPLTLAILKLCLNREAHSPEVMKRSRTEAMINEQASPKRPSSIGRHADARISRRRQRGDDNAYPNVFCCLNSYSVRLYNICVCFIDRLPLFLQGHLCISMIRRYLDLLLVVLSSAAPIS